MSQDLIRINQRHLERTGAGDLAKRAMQRADNLNEQAGEGWRCARVLRFPADRAIGHVDTMIGSGVDIRYERLALALGEVAIAAGAKVIVEVTKLDANVLDCIAQLDPGAIQGLVLRGAGGGVHCMPESRFVAHLTDLRQLQLRDAHVDLTHLARLVHLDDLAIERCTLDDGAAASQLAHLSQLQELRLVDLQLDWRGLQVPDQLRVFSANGSRFDAPLDRLAGCTGLTILRLRGAARKDWDALERFKALRELDVRSTVMDDADTMALPSITELREFDATSTQISDPTMRRISQLLELRNIYVDDTRITNAGVRAIRALPNLQVLFCAAPRITGSVLRSIGMMSMIYNVHIGGIGATDEHAAHLDSLEHLRYLHAGNNEFTDELGTALHHLLPRLIRCDVDHSDIGRSTIMRLGESNKLQYLGINGCTSVESLRPILQHGKLRTVRAVDANALCSLGSLERCTGLEQLTLTGTFVGAGELSGLHSLTALRCLELGGLAIDDRAIAEVLVSMPLLETLDLCGTRVSDSTLQQLVEHPNLRVLHLDDTGVTSAGMRAAATCERLEQLSLARTACDDAALEHLHELTRRRRDKPLAASTAVGRERACSDKHLSGARLVVKDPGALDVAGRIDQQLEQLGIAVPVSNASKLQILDVQGCDISPDSLMSLRGHPALALVKIDHCQQWALPARHRDGVDGTSIRFRAFDTLSHRFRTLLDSTPDEADDFISWQH